MRKDILKNKIKNRILNHDSYETIFHYGRIPNGRSLIWYSDNFKIKFYFNFEEDKKYRCESDYDTLNSLAILKAIPISFRIYLYEDHENHSILSYDESKYLEKSDLGKWCFDIFTKLEIEKSEIRQAQQDINKRIKENLRQEKLKLL